MRPLPSVPPSSELRVSSRKGTSANISHLAGLLSSGEQAPYRR